ncbi:leucine rich repeat containing 51 isoform X2 [Scophthalmus maximus]|nr:leucine rich repeat containing 51 isoform X2 [Scophthalmus maximus]
MNFGVRRSRISTDSQQATNVLKMFGAPVDLSFNDIGNLEDAWTEEPRSGLRPIKRTSESKYQSHCLRLNNNNIVELHGLQKTIKYFLAEPLQLAWLDLSFNKITHIDPILSELRELHVLYLHGNGIYIPSEVERLGVLPHLHTITLHGNIIEADKNYRNHVITTLPRLKTMDFSAVTRQERIMANLWHQSNSRSRRGKKPAQ